MTNEQINIAIAESLGWTNCRLAIKGAGGGTRYLTAHGIPPNRKYEASCPNYTFDLNACHEFENVLDLQACGEYARWLRDVVLMKTKLPWVDYGSFAHINATARQRCEAYLITIGKWKE